MQSYYYTRGAKAAGQTPAYHTYDDHDTEEYQGYTFTDEDSLLRVEAASRIHHQTTGGGISGSSGEGLTGTITAQGIHGIFQAADIGGKHVLDLGASDGRVLFQALAYGSASATGVELPVNASAQQYIVSATAHRMSRAFPEVDFQRQLVYIHQDIMKMEEIPRGVDYVYSFWFGFPIDVKWHILQLIAHSDVTTFTVFRQPGHINDPEELLEMMERFGVLAVFDGANAVHMHGSGGGMTAWTFRIPRW